jgi:hypothetical protein
VLPVILEFEVRHPGGEAVALSKDAMRLLDEVRSAKTLEDVREVVARWQWELVLSIDPDLPAKMEETRRHGGTPITLEQLKVRLGL